MSRPDLTSTARHWGIRGLLLPALLAAGCGPSKASVSGMVTFQGRALPSGTVLFHGEDGRVEHALIGADGGYALADAPTGAVRITVQSHPAMPAGFPTSGEGPPPAPPELAAMTKDRHDGSRVAIPLRYLDPGQSGLTCTVRPGSQTHDIELQP
jgi:hypothetical protein